MSAIAKLRYFLLTLLVALGLGLGGVAQAGDVASESGAESDSQDTVQWDDDEDDEWEDEEDDWDDGDDDW